MLGLAVVAFQIFDMAVLSDVEAMHTVVFAVLAAAIMDAAACNDDHVAVLADEKFVGDGLLMSGCRDHDRDAAGLIPGAVFDIDIDAAAVLTGSDLDVCGGIPALGFAVYTDIVSTGRCGMNISDFRQDTLFDIFIVQIDHQNAPPS